MHNRVKVCIRIRSTGDEEGSSQVLANEETAVVEIPGQQFKFDHVLPKNVSQENLFNKVAKPIVNSVIEGYNGTISAYGQTGSGKTFTMNGKADSFGSRGICARSIAHIFNAKKQSSSSLVIRVSYIEIYNEQLLDLLTFDEASAATAAPRANLIIQQTKTGESFVKGLSRPIVDSEDDALEKLFEGETNRTISEHCLNKSSTRSHCIFTIYIEKAATAENERVSSKLNLVDLAGSERMKKTQTSGTMFKEATHINKSLSFLEQVVVALGDKTRDHIPFRSSKLTTILKDSLGGNCCTLFISCIWPDSSHLDQSVSTLRFSTRLMNVQNVAVVNVIQSSDESAKKYLREIKQLRKELAMYDTLNGRREINYGEMTSERRAYLKQEVQKYIGDTKDEAEIPAETRRDVQETFSIFRQMIREGGYDNNVIISNQITTNQKESNVAETEKRTIAAPLAASGIIDMEDPRAEEDRMESFKKSEVGKKLGQTHEQAKANLKAAKKSAKKSAIQVNVLKSEIDALMKLSSQAAEQGAEGGDNSNSNNNNEGDNLVQQLRAAKKSYRSAFEHHKELLSEVKFLQRAKECTVENIAREYRSWGENIHPEIE